MSDPNDTNADTGTEDHGGAPESGEWARLEAIAAAGDARVAGADVLPGQELPTPKDHAAEIASLLGLVVMASGNMLPTIPKYFPPTQCEAIATAYMACAEKHGWTWHENTGGPEITLAVAIAVPAFMCAKETRDWLRWQREQQEAAQAQPVSQSRGMVLHGG